LLNNVSLALDVADCKRLLSQTRMSFATNQNVSSLGKLVIIILKTKNKIIETLTQKHSSESLNEMR